MHPDRAHRLRSSLIAAALFACVALPAQRSADLPVPAPLGQAATEALVARYEAADHWVQRAVILLSLNHSWHPAGSAMILDAVRSSDERLQAFGIEALLRSEDGLLPTVASAALVSELIEKQLSDKNDHYRERVAEALTRIAPTAGATDKSGWNRWWQGVKETYKPAEWLAKEVPTDDGGGTVAMAQRAFDLHQYGLDMMLCIDSTGSMQPTIDALGSALGDMVDILDGLSPKLRLGIVHYKDYGELGKGGAKVVQPFSKNIKTARKNLEKLRAHGGADLPEAVLGGLQLALSPKMKWQKDANKLVVLIGDAPSHPDETEAVIALVKAAYETPGQQAGKPTTGAAAATAERSFLTSTIGVFVELTGTERPRGWDEFVASQKQMRTDFAAIAKAGGGVFVEVNFKFEMGPPPTSKEKKENAQKTSAVASTATRSIVEHILVLSFGERFTREMREFARVYYDYKNAGLIK